jgi:23S rRNA pseudouridine1911/1915/1917 synthase
MIYIMNLAQYLIENNYFSNKSEAKNFVKNGFIKVNESILNDHKYVVKENDEVQVIDKKPSIKVLYENDDFMIVFKPSGLSVCRTKFTPKYEYVLNELIAEKHKLSAAKKTEESGLVHRLDKDVSGLMFLTKTNNAYEKFLQFFKDRLVGKKYEAFVNKDENLDFNGFYDFICPHGYRNFSLYNQCFCEEYCIAKEIEVNLEYKGNKTVQGEKTDSISRFIVNGNKITVFPITGRKHQVRFVAKYLGYPILGDKIYGGKKYDKLCLYCTSYRVPDSVVLEF